MKYLALDVKEPSNQTKSLFGIHLQKLDPLLCKYIITQISLDHQNIKRDA